MFLIYNPVFCYIHEFTISLYLRAKATLFYKIIEAVNDPERKDSMLKELLKNATTLTDENGETHKLISLGGLYLDPKFFQAPGQTLNDTKTIPFRDDDILLLTHPKTGTYAF